MGKERKRSDAGNGAQGNVPMNDKLLFNISVAEEDIVFKIGIDMPGMLRSIERKLVCVAVGVANGNTSVAARLLGIKRTTLHEKLRKMGY